MALWLKLYRVISTEKSTQGEVFIDSLHECFTLELVNCIQEGTYKIVLDFSNRFQRIMPHILNVPNFEGIRIHPGNTDKDTTGCILVGLNRSPDQVGLSQMAFNRLMEKFQAATDKKEDIWIEIIHAPFKIEQKMETI